MGRYSYGVIGCSQDGIYMLKITDFFGLAIDEESSDIKYLMVALGIDELINDTKVVKKLSKQNGVNAAIVNVARRQQLLKMIKPMLNDKLLEHEPNYYLKEINTSSEHDRRYDAEEHLLHFALIVASTKSKKVLESSQEIITCKLLREGAFLGSRYDRCWEILSQASSHIVSAFRKSK